MRVYGIQIIESKVRLSVDPKGVIAGTAQVDTSMQRTMDKTKKAVNQFGYLYLSLKRIATYTAIFSFFAKTIQLLGQVVQLELRQAEVMTLVDMRNEQAAASYNRVIAAITKMPPRLGSAIELTKGLYEIMSAGVSDPEEAFILLNASANYAKAGLTELSVAASTLTAVMKAYGLQAEEMRAKSDSMFASVMEGKYHADEFNDALGKILPTAAAMGVSIEEVSAMMAVLTQRGLDANQASTAFNRMLISLLKPMDKAKDKLEMLGIEYGINAFRTRDLGQTLVKLADAQSRYGDILPEIFRRQRGLRAAFIATGSGLKDYERMLEKVRDAQEGEGEVARAAAKIHATVYDTIQAVKNSLLQTASAWIKHSGAARTAVAGVGQFLNALLRQPAGIVAAAAAHKILSAALVTQNMKLKETISTWMVMENQRVHNKAIDYARYDALKKESEMMGTRIKRLRAVRIGLMAVVAAVVVGIEIWRSWKQRADEQNAALKESAEKMEKIREESKILATVIGNATGEFEDLDPVVQNLAKHMALVDLEQMHSDFLKVASDAVLVKTPLEAQMHAWANMQKVILDVTNATSMWSKRRDKVESELIKMREEIEAGTFAWENHSWILAQYAVHGGYVEKAIKDVENSFLAMEGVAGDAVRKLRSEFLFLMRDIPSLQEAMDMHWITIKDTYDIPKMKSMIQTLEDLSKGLSKELMGELTKAGVDLKKINIPLLLEQIKLALHKKEFEDATQNFNELVATITHNFDKLYPGMEKLTDAYNAVMVAFAQSKDLKMPIKVFAKEAEDLLTMLFNNWDNLTPVMQKGIEVFREFVEKGAGATGKARQAAIKKAEDWANEYINIMRNIAMHENKLSDESYNNVIERTKAANTIKRREMKEEYDNLVKYHGLSLMHWAQYYRNLKALKEEERMAEQVAEADRILAIRKRHEQLLGSDYEYNFQKLQAAEEFYRLEREEIINSQVLDEKSKAERLASAKTFWEAQLEAIKNAQTKYEKLIAVLKIFGGMFSRMAGSFREMFEALHLESSFSKNFVDILETLGTAFLKISGAIADAERAMKSWGTEAKNFINKLGRVATVADAVVTIVTSLITVIAKLFSGKSPEAKAAEAAEALAKEQDLMVRKQMQLYKAYGGLSESMAKAWAELRQTGIPGWLAELKLLDRIMTDVGINVNNFTLFAQKMSEVLYATRDGFIESYEGADIFSKSFKQLIDYAKEHGLEGSKVILDLIRQTRDLGIEVIAVSQYVEEQLNKAGAGLLLMIQWVAKDAVEAHNSIKDMTKEKRKLLRQVEQIQERMAKFGMGSTEYQEAKKELDDLLESIAQLDKDITKAQGVIDAVGKDTRRHLRNLGQVVYGVFSSMVAEGRNMFEIYEAMGASIVALRERFKALGMEVPTYLKPLFKIFGSMDANSEFYKGMEGLMMVYEGLGNSLYLSQDAFRALNREAKTYWDLMRTPKKEGGLGLGDTAAMQMMYPLLQKMWWYAEQYNLKLPQWATQAIKQMEKAGFKFEAPIENQQLEHIKSLDELALRRNELLKTIAKNVWLTKNALVTAPTYQAGTPNIGGSHFARLHHGEAVVPSNLADALRQFFSGRSTGELNMGGGVAMFVIQLDSQQLYKGLLPRLREGGSFGDFELAGEGVV